MIDLIRRTDALKAIWGEDINPSDDGLVFEAQSHIDRDIRLIPSADHKTAPSIDIVRCKECKWWVDNLTENDDDEAYDSCRWDWSRKIPTADDFCSYGEREGE